MLQTASPVLKAVNNMLLLHLKGSFWKQHCNRLHISLFSSCEYNQLWWGVVILFSLPSFSLKESKQFKDMVEAKIQLGHPSGFQRNSQHLPISLSISFMATDFISPICMGDSFILLSKEWFSISLLWNIYPTKAITCELHLWNNTRCVSTFKREMTESLK